MVGGGRIKARERKQRWPMLGAQVGAEVGLGVAGKGNMAVPTEHKT